MLHSAITPPTPPQLPWHSADALTDAHAAIDAIAAIGHTQQRASDAAHDALDHAIAQQLHDAARAAAYGASAQAVYQAGILATDDQRHQLHAMADAIASDYGVRHAPTPADAIKVAAGLGVSAGLRIAKNWPAQAEGRADAFGLDPDDRIRSWEGRYDGAA